MPNEGTTKDENKHPLPTPPPSEGEGEGGGWFYLRVKFPKRESLEFWILVIQICFACLREAAAAKAGISSFVLRISWVKGLLIRSSAHLL